MHTHTHTHTQDYTRTATYQSAMLQNPADFQDKVIEMLFAFMITQLSCTGCS